MLIGFRLKAGRDDDLIEWIESLGSRDKSYYIRESLRRDITAQKGGSIDYLPPSPVIESDENKAEDVPKRAAKKEFDIKKNDVSVDDLEKALKSWM